MMRYLALALGLVGCAVETRAEPELYDAQTGAVLERAQLVTIDPSVAPADLAEIVRAIDDWNAVLTCAQLSPVVAPVAVGDRFGVRTVTREALADCSGLPEGEKLGPGIYVMGCANAEGIRLLADSPIIYQIAGHELGHMLGLQHTAEAGKLMSTLGETNIGPSASDGAAACADR